MQTASYWEVDYAFMGASWWGGAVESGRSRNMCCVWDVSSQEIHVHTRLTYSLGAHVPERYRMAIPNADCKLIGVGSGDIRGGGDHG